MTDPRQAHLTRAVVLDVPLRRALQLWEVLSRQQQLDRVDRVLVLSDPQAAAAGSAPPPVVDDVDPRMIREGGPTLGGLIESGSVEFVELTGERTKLTVRLWLTPSVETPSAVLSRLAELRLDYLFRGLTATTGT